MNESGVLNNPTIQVAVAVIYGDDDRILIAERPSGSHLSGYWEFPGGKVESSESVVDALKRELYEEVNIRFNHHKPLIQIYHEYSDRSIMLNVWQVSGVEGQAIGKEGQKIQWIEKQKLQFVNFLPANKPIVNAVLLANKYMVTGQFLNSNSLLSSVENQLNNGINLIQFRAPWLDEAAYRVLAKELHQLCQLYQARLLLKGGLPLLKESWCDGVHLTSNQLMKNDVRWMKWRRSDQWVSASCHNRQELLRAKKMDVDFVTLSPIKLTSSHPNAKPLGVEKAIQLTRNSTIPVYWLGGMQNDDMAYAMNHGAQGIAGIELFSSI